MANVDISPGDLIYVDRQRGTQHPRCVIARVSDHIIYAVIKDGQITNEVWRRHIDELLIHTVIPNVFKPEEYAHLKEKINV